MFSGYNKRAVHISSPEVATAQARQNPTQRGEVGMKSHPSTGFLKWLFIYSFYVHLCIYVWVSVWHRMGVEVKRQLARLISLLLPCGSQAPHVIKLGSRGPHHFSGPQIDFFFTSNFLMLNLRVKSLYKTNFFFLEFRVWKRFPFSCCNQIDMVYTVWGWRLDGKIIWLYVLSISG